MQWIENHLLLVVRPRVAGNAAIVAEHFDAIDVRLHDNFGERITPRHAVTIPFPRERLILVDGSRFAHAVIEGTGRKSQRRLFFLVESFCDRSLFTADGSGLILFATTTQVRVEFIHVVDVGNGRCPILLHPFNPTFDVRLLVASSGLAEHGLEVVMARQRLIRRIQLSIATFQYRGCNRLGIIPPKFFRNTTEEGKRFDRAAHDRFDFLARKAIAKTAFE